MRATEFLLQLSLKLRRDPTSAAAARRFVSRALRQAGRHDIDGDDRDGDDVIVLLTNELVTNAILHAESEIDVVVDVTGDRVRVEVHDATRRAPVRRPGEPTSTAGRGLELVEALASDWGVELIPGDGKAVWFEVTE